MGWTSKQAQSVTAVDAISYARSNVILLNPNEVCHFRIKHTLAPMTDPWAVDIEDTLDDLDYGGVPYMRFMAGAADSYLSGIIGGLYGFRFGAFNAAVSAPTDIPTMIFEWRVNGIDL